MSIQTFGKLERKAKRSYALSPESVAFLEAMRKKQQSKSISAILDGILQTLRREHELASIERAVAASYGSLSTEEVTDQVEWGEFALHEFPNEKGT